MLPTPTLTSLKKTNPVILSRNHLYNAYGIKAANSTLLRWEDKGSFPRRIRLGSGNVVGWLADEIEAYVASLAANRAEAAR